MSNITPIDYLVKPDKPVETLANLESDTVKKPDNTYVTPDKVNIPLANNVPVLTESKENKDLKYSKILIVALVAVTVLFYLKGKK